MANRFRSIQITSLKNGARVADKCGVAESFFQRLVGLIGKKFLEVGEGLLISPCNDIHMWFMSIPIDVVFVCKQQSETGSLVLRVSSVQENLRPWRVFPVRDFKASDTLELPIGTVQRCNILTGDILCISSL